MDIKENRSKPAEQKTVAQLQKTATHKIWIGTHILLAITSITLYFLFRSKVFNIAAKYNNFMLKLCLAFFCCFCVLILTKVVELLIARHSHTKAVKYNIVRIIRLATILVIAFIGISFINSNWYTAAVSLGLLSLILGFALQTPIASLIGWFYIVFRAPYKIGDRIQLSTFTGDVVEINYLDTTLWEFAGSYMTNDLPSGRLIRFPNSLVFQSQVYNYSWEKFPYIWNEIPFHIAYNADLGFVEKIMLEAAKNELGEKMEERVKQLRNVISQTPVDELEIKEFPFVSFRITDNSWVEVLLIYLVEPKKAYAVRNTLIKKILKVLAENKDKTKFPSEES